MDLILKDSQYIKGISKEDWYETALYCQMVEELKRKIKSKNIEFFSLGGNGADCLDEDLIWYEIESIRGKKSKVVNRATFFTSHYIGFYSDVIDEKTVNLMIEPRFGNGIFNYLLSFTYGIYLPKGFSSSSNARLNSLWLLAILWKATLEKAMTKSQIPKEYKKHNKNLDTFKGQLDIAKHIKHNFFDKSRFYCYYRKFTMDTTINQAIRYTYKLLEKKGYGNILKDIEGYDKMLQFFGVHNKAVSLNEIQNIRYSKLNIYYKKVMELSSLIIKNRSKNNSILSSLHDSFSYFLDISELWENYLLKILQKNLSEYYIYSPNEKRGIGLFEDGSRKVRPDIIIEKDGNVVAVLDAKYKWYNKIGNYTDIDHSVSRDDLYQMTTYLYHYGKENKKILGFFISPIEQSHEESKILKNNPQHKIGVINLDIEQFNQKENEKHQPTKFSLENIKNEEKRFIEKIKGELNNFI